MIYIASPFTDKRFSIMGLRFDINLFFTTKLIQKKVICFNPIVYGWNFYNKLLLPNDPNTWNFVNSNFMEFCSHLLVLQLDGWESSKGVFEEVGYFMGENRNISYMTQEDVFRIVRGDDFELFINDNNYIDWRIL